jgi:uncharacterized protein (UPF0335 family)
MVSNALTDTRLKSIVQRAKNLYEQRKIINDDIKDLMLEAKSAKYNLRVVRGCVRKTFETDADIKSRLEFEEQINAAMASLGDLD